MTKDTNTQIRNDKRTILEIAIKQDIIKKLRPHLTQPSMGVSPQKIEKHIIHNSQLLLLDRPCWMIICIFTFEVNYIYREVHLLWMRANIVSGSYQASTLETSIGQFDWEWSGGCISC